MDGLICLHIRKSRKNFTENLDEAKMIGSFFRLKILNWRFQFYPEENSETSEGQALIKRKK